MISRALIVQFFKFGIVGVIGFVVDSAVLMFATEILGLDPYTGRALSFLVAATTTWICNRHFTFKGIGSGSAFAQWAKFMVACAGGFVLNYGTYATLVAFLSLKEGGLIWAVAAGSLAGMFFNFFTTKKMVFK